MSEKHDVDQVEQYLQNELAREKKNSLISYIMSGLLVVFVLIYTAWLGARVGELLDPEGLALAASGMVIEKVPDVRTGLEQTLVKGAPGIARSVTDEIVGAIPSFRQYIEEQLGPVVDQAAQEMAAAAMVNLMAEVKSANFKEKAAKELARALLDEFHETIEYALDEADATGQTPRQRIDAALASLKKIDRELKILEGGKRLSTEREKERELLMGWLEILVNVQHSLPPPETQ